ncbi:hypothetical protein GCM10007989_07230 [Devosia pacifica]|uniref:Lysozyme family protein n=1 Tax=Devosia pacifica TaxID=1335967 RepID=A0A918RWB1_9HYPH|nr:glycoside hydrolase family 108 protein [Devosia pacifica]GHA15035.1 hypothetical protein GCM10007989_07230 [Devosia pacifica]
MNRNFERSLSAVLSHEGGYVDHPQDPGGATNLGVTIGTARRLGIDIDGDGDTDKVDIRMLTRADAAKVYRAEYWDKVRAGDLPDGVDHAVFDFAVNSGPSRAARYLQAVLGVTQDGVIGPVTVAASRRKDAETIVTRLCDKRMDFLRGLSTFSTFGRGWTRRVSEVEALALDMIAESPVVPEPVQKIPAPSLPSIDLPSLIRETVETVMPTTGTDLPIRIPRPSPVAQVSKAVGAGKWAALGGAIWSGLVISNVVPAPYNSPEFSVVVGTIVQSIAAIIGAYRAPRNAE